MGHYELIERGLALHESEKYDKAIVLFELALEDHPLCPAGIYNYANTSYMLGRYEESEKFLRLLIETDDGALRDGCPDVPGSPRSYKLDAYYMLFHVTLTSTKSWQKAYRYGRKHLELRARGVKSVWSKRQIEMDLSHLNEETESSELQLELAPWNGETVIVGL